MLPTDKESRALALMGAYERAAKRELKIRKWLYNRRSKAGPSSVRGYTTWVKVAELLDDHGIDYDSYCDWWMVYWLDSRETRTVRTTTPPIGMLGSAPAIKRFAGRGATNITTLQIRDADHWIADARSVIKRFQGIVQQPLSQILPLMWQALPAPFLACCQMFHDAVNSGAINTEINHSHHQNARRYYADFRSRGVLSNFTTQVALVCVEAENAS